MPGKREPPAWFGSLIGGNRDQSGLRYLRNRYYDPATEQFTQEDPIGIAGGDPVNFSDPFGLCAAASDSLKIDVTRDCGDGTTDTVTVWAQQASPEDIAAVMSAAQRLTGGDPSVGLGPSDVQWAYGQVTSQGNIYTFPTSIGGFNVLQGAKTQTGAGSGHVAFRADAMAAIRAGALGQMIGNLGFNAATIVGHEGVHLLQPGDENLALSIMWSFIP